jgi:hypothetical protein
LVEAILAILCVFAGRWIAARLRPQVAAALFFAGVAAILLGALYLRFS